MRTGIDSYSYHRRYGEMRAGEVAPAVAPPWPLEPSPVLAHARALAVDDLYLETCYLPEPEAIDRRRCSRRRARCGSASRGGIPWPAGAFHGLDGGRTPAAEDHLARWIAAAARLGHPVMRITLGSPGVAWHGARAASWWTGSSSPPAAPRSARGEVGLELAIENHGDLRAQDMLEVIERSGCRQPGRDAGQREPHPGGRRHARGHPCPGAPNAPGPAQGPPADAGHDHAGGPLSVALGEGVAPLERDHRDLAAAGYDGPSAWSSPRWAARTWTSSR